jgi:hypothetical protein
MMELAQMVSFVAGAGTRRIRGAVLLKTGANSEASKAFLAFLKVSEARAIIEQFGYALE